MGHRFRGTRTEHYVLMQERNHFWVVLLKKKHSSNKSEKAESFRDLQRQALQGFITQETEQTFHQKEKQSAKAL